MKNVALSETAMTPGWNLGASALEHEQPEGSIQLQGIHVQSWKEMTEF